ncbi:unnamed protein product, partial [Coregonus sp. 'balchen']
ATTALGQEIREAVLSVLPDLPEQTLSSLLDKLARQARSDTAGAIKDTSTFEPSSPSPSQSSSTYITTCSTTSTTSTVDLDIWLENFIVTWGKTSMNLRSAIARGTWRTPGERREMVRITVDAMRVTEPNLTRADCRAIAKRMVQRYPSSFATFYTFNQEEASRTLEFFQ